MIDRHWHLDRRVPIALIGAILLQSFAAGWFAAELNQRVAAIERFATDNRTAVERIARIEERLDSIKESLAALRASVEPRAPAR
jgi:CHASE1-domain containing sensor protein